MVALGRYGVWSAGFVYAEPEAIRAASAEVERLGYGAIWMGGSPTVDRAKPVLDATSSIAVATGITTIWDDNPTVMGRKFAELESDHPGRFLLGLGASHARIQKKYDKPYSTMVAFLDGLDAADQPIPADRRVLAALGPKMLKLSADRALGAHPYLVTPEHTAQARALIGPAALLAPEVKVVVETDPGRARALGRHHLAMYLKLPNYVNNLRRLGFTDEDFADGGSDHLVDSVVAWGDSAAIRARIAAFESAGADHIVFQAISEDRSGLTVADWRSLASLLDL